MAFNGQPEVTMSDNSGFWAVGGAVVACRAFAVRNLGYLLARDGALATARVFCDLAQRALGRLRARPAESPFRLRRDGRGRGRCGGLDDLDHDPGGADLHA